MNEIKEALDEAWKCIRYHENGSNDDKDDRYERMPYCLQVPDLRERVLGVINTEQKN